MQRDESPAVSNSAAKASGGDDETEDDATAAARYAREAESAARNAAVASQINDSLQRNIQLTQQKVCGLYALFWINIMCLHIEVPVINREKNRVKAGRSDFVIQIIKVSFFRGGGGLCQLIVEGEF